MINNLALDRLEEGVLLIDSNEKIIFANKFFLQKAKYKEVTNCYLGDIFINKGICLQEGLNFTYKEDVRLILKNGENSVVKVGLDLGLDEEKGENGQKIYWAIVKYWENDNYTKEELADILDCMPYAIWIEDRKGAYRYINKVNLNEMRAVLGEGLTEDDIYNEQVQAVWKDTLNIKMFHKDREEIEKGNVIYDKRKMKLFDKTLNYAITKLPIRDAKGDIKAIIGIKDNSAQRRQIEEKLIAGYRRYRQNEIMQLFDGKLKVDAKWEMKHFDSGRYLGAEGMTLCEYVKDQEILKVASCIGKSGVALQSLDNMKISTNKFKKILQEQYVWKINDGDKSTINIDIEKLKKLGIQYVVQHPITYKNHVLGILLVQYEDANSLTVITKKQIEDMCYYLAVIMKNIKLMEELENQVLLNKKAKKQVQDLFDTTIGLYSVYDFKKNERLVNIGWNEMLDWGQQDVTGIETIYEEDRQGVLEELEAIRNGAPSKEMVSRFYCKDGRYKWIKWKAKLGQNESAYIFCGIDVTDNINSVEERKAYHKALEIEALKNAFLANMSHELKTPLNIIYSIMQLTEIEMKDKIEESRFRRYAKMMKQNIFRLLKLINNFVDISNIDAKQFSLNMENYNIVDIVHNMIVSICHYLENEPIEILFKTSFKELELACDIDGVERMIINLISNAIKYTKTPKQIIVSLTKERHKNSVDYAVITVKDNGIGIPEEQLKTIFDRFMRVDKSLTRKCEGSGIGLALVKDIAELHGGKVSVRSEVGKGSEFIIKLPVKKIDNTKKRMQIDTVNSRFEKCCIEFSDIYYND